MIDKEESMRQIMDIVDGWGYAMGTEESFARIQTLSGVHVLLAAIHEIDRVANGKQDAVEALDEVKRIITCLVGYYSESK